MYYLQKEINFRPILIDETEINQKLNDIQNFIKFDEHLNFHNKKARTEVFQINEEHDEEIYSPWT